MTTDYHLFGIGNALLDTEYLVTDEFLVTNQVQKGQMTLIDPDRRKFLLQNTSGEPHDIGAGGSVANSIYAAQGFGCRNYFAGVVQADKVGNSYLDEFAKVGIDTLPPRETEDGTSGQCLIYVTPDGQRSMNASIGIADSFDLCELPKVAIKNSEMVFVEGYLAGATNGRVAGRQVIHLARESGVGTSMTLGDVSMIHHFRDEIKYMLAPELDILFANVNEALAWCDADTIESTFDTMLELANTCVITRSEEGCIVLQRDQEALYVSGLPQQPLDSSGAGDLFAGAFLTGFVNNWEAYRCASFANFAASTIVRQYGARLHSFDTYGKLWQTFNQDQKLKGIS